ncbi:IPT/TIG domain-containing protein [Thalassomonas actiniarum]|uniref:IPT/TIG domain-containing protein n=1 Tax=Thalassomonas actiniarum TaxID=485447 RepID=A0AAE9YWT6_9GAMM|nr:IPT/TIG domain-containing protein [Thalassomonas actiniarum]WDE01022.1 IPT/TIG domain-containing protein [Thalassomonas actiniarum]
MKKSTLSLAFKMLFSGVLAAGSAVAQASYWDEGVCSFGMGTSLAPGESFLVSASVGALRNTTSTIPISFYYSLTPSVTGSSQYLGGNSATVFQPGSYCSSVVQTTLTLPTTSQGLDCFIDSGGYILAKVGDDVNDIGFNINGYIDDVIAASPKITSFSPASGHSGSIVHINGSLFDDNTAVYIDGIAAARGILSSEEIIALVPAGASTGYIQVKKATGHHKLCSTDPGRSPSQFVVTPVPAYCDSGASNNGYGKIAYVKLDNNSVYNEVGTTNCPNYTDNTGFFTTTSPGLDVDTIQVQFGTCGTTAYTRMFKVYADWNQDTDFDDPAEYFLAAPSVASDQLYDLTIPVPDFASIGTTRLRMITALYYTGTVDTVDDVQACGYYPFGETQDYVLDVTSVNGVLQAKVKASIDNTVEPLDITGQVIDLINNNESLTEADKQNFIDKYVDKLPGLTFSYPKGQER